MWVRPPRQRRCRFRRLARRPCPADVRAGRRAARRLSPRAAAMPARAHATPQWRLPLRRRRCPLPCLLTPGCQRGNALCGAPSPPARPRTSRAAVVPARRSGMVRPAIPFAGDRGENRPSPPYCDAS
jgi:hypothetical protein